MRVTVRGADRLPSGVWTAPCKDLQGLSVSTLERYWSYLEHSYLVFDVTDFSASERAMQKRGRKAYFTDCALRNADLQRAPEALDAPDESGALLENLVASHLRILALQGSQRLHYWRRSSRRGDAEVDFILDHPEKPVVLEVGSRDDLTRSRADDPWSAGRIRRAKAVEDLTVLRARRRLTD